MNKGKAAPKEVLTFRTDPERLKQLRILAETQNTTVSALVDSAIEMLLENKGNPTVLLTTEDVAKALPVVEAIGKPVPLSLFLTLIETLRGS